MKNRSLRTSVPVQLANGQRISAVVGSIQNWTAHHGLTAAGTQVNSIESATIGESILLKHGPAVLSATRDEIEVFARQFLTGMGFTVTAPATMKA